MSGRHYLITGGAGFIGSAIARRLLARGDEVTVVDNLSSGSIENVPAGARFIHADLRDGHALDAVETGVAGILHLGGQPSAEVSEAEPQYTFDSNERGTFMLLQWAARRRIRRVLFASSMAVYGSAVGSLHEDAPLVPASVYGVSKIAGELALALFGRQGGQTTALRMFNVYGPGQNLTNMRQGMVSIYLSFLLRGEPILVKGAADRYRDLIYVDDVVDGWMTALDRPDAIGRVYNLGTGVRTTVRMLIDGLIEAAGERREYPVVCGEPTAGDVHGSVADITRASNEMGWRPRVDVAQGLRRTIDWARRTPAPTPGP